MDTYINLPKPMGRVDEGQWATTMVWRLSMTNSVGPNRYRFRHTRIDAYAHRDDITNTHMCCGKRKTSQRLLNIWGLCCGNFHCDWWLNCASVSASFLGASEGLTGSGWQVLPQNYYIYIYIYIHYIYFHVCACIYTHADTHRVMWAGVKIKCHIAMLQDDNTSSEFNIPIERKPQECLGEYPHMFHTLTLTHVSLCRYFDLLIDYILIESNRVKGFFFFCGSWDLQEALRKLALKSHTSKKLGVLCGSHPKVFTEALCCVNKKLIRMKNIYAGLSIGYPPKFDGGSSFFPHWKILEIGERTPIS